MNYTHMVELNMLMSTRKRVTRRTILAYFTTIWWENYELYSHGRVEHVDEYKAEGDQENYPGLHYLGWDKK